MQASMVPIDRRPRTFGEMWNPDMIQDNRLAEKIKAGQGATALLQQRIEFIDSVSNLAVRVDQYQERRLETQLAVLKLEDEIFEHNALRDIRRQTLLADATAKQQQLLEPPSFLSERERLVQEHRDELKAKATATLGALNDLITTCREVFELPAPEEQRAAAIRELLRVYQQPESVLPRRIRAFLEYVEMEEE